MLGSRSEAQVWRRGYGKSNVYSQFQYPFLTSMASDVLVIIHLLIQQTFIDNQLTTVPSLTNSRE